MSGSTATKEYNRSLTKSVVFDGKAADWSHWSDKFLSVAYVNGYEGVLLGDEKPVPATQVTKTKEEERVFKANKEAYANLVLSCSGTAYGAVSSAKTKDHPRGDAGVAWKNLCDRFEAVDNSTKVELKGEFEKCALQSRKNPDQWFDELDSLRQRLSQVKAEVSDEDLKIHIMNHLPVEFSELTTSLHTMDFDTMTLSHLQQMVRGYYKRKVESKEKPSGEKGIAMPGFQKKFKGLCRSCGKFGHKAADCRGKDKKGKEEGGYRAHLECSNCGKKGHSEKTCWLKNRNGGRKSEDATIGMFAATATVLTCTKVDKVVANQVVEDDWELCEMFDVQPVNQEKENNEEKETNEEKENNEEKVNEKKYEKIESKEFSGMVQYRHKETYQSGANSEKWLIDSGASVHITNNDKRMTMVVPAFETVVVGNGMEVKSQKKGTVTIMTDKGMIFQMTDVLYIPHFEKNLLSVAKLTSKGATVSANSETMNLTKGNLKIIAEKEKGNNGMYYVTGERSAPYEQGLAAVNKAPKSIDVNVAHELLGHARGTSLVKLAKTANWKLTGTLTKCEACALAKGKARSVSKAPAERASEAGTRLYTDLSGPYKSSLGGNKYWAIIVDDYSRMKWSYFIPEKSAIGKVVEKVLDKINGMHKSTKYLRCDNAGENKKELSELCVQRGIQIEFTAPNTPQQNGVAERAFAVILDGALSSMIGAKLTTAYQGFLWAEAVYAQTKIRNMIPMTGESVSPIELFTGETPNYGNLIQWGRVGFVTVRDKYIKKLENRAMKCVFVGYADDHSQHTYRFFNPKTRQIIMSRDVTWADWHGLSTATHDLSKIYNETKETIIERLKESEDEQEQQGSSQPTEIADYDDDEDLPVLIPYEKGELDAHQDQGNAPPPHDNEEENDPTPIAGRTRAAAGRIQGRPGSGRNVIPVHPRVIRNLNTSYNPIEVEEEEVEEEDVRQVYYVFNASLASDPGLPRTYKEASKGNEKAEWQEASEGEIRNFEKRKVWTLVDRTDIPQGKAALKTRWIFKKNQSKIEGETKVKYKARLVVKGYEQIPGVDFTESFSPVANDTTIRTSLAYALHQGWIVDSIDVEAAFLNADLEEEVHIEIPEGYSKEPIKGDKVLRLLKAVYGLVQAPRAWFKEFTQKLIAIGLEKCKTDPCLFIVRDKHKSAKAIGALVLYVDDCAVMGEDETVRKNQERYKWQVHNH
jgi:hypothetical protein